VPDSVQHALRLPGCAGEVTRPFAGLRVHSHPPSAGNPQPRRPATYLDLRSWSGSSAVICVAVFGASCSTGAQIEVAGFQVVWQARLGLWIALARRQRERKKAGWAPAGHPDRRWRAHAIPQRTGSTLSSHIAVRPARCVSRRRSNEARALQKRCEECIVPAHPWLGRPDHRAWRSGRRRGHKSSRRAIRRRMRCMHPRPPARPCAPSQSRPTPHPAGDQGGHQQPNQGEAACAQPGQSGAHLRDREDAARARCAGGGGPGRGGGARGGRAAGPRRRPAPPPPPRPPTPPPPPHTAPATGPRAVSPQATM